MATRAIKCIVTGDRQAGKTCFIIACMKKTFPTTYIPQEADDAFIEVSVNGTTCYLALWDTWFQQDDCAQSLRPLRYPQTDVILICLSTVSPDSIQNLKKRFVGDEMNEWVPGWVSEITTYCRNVPFILVGTKTDLREDREVIDRLEESGEQPLSKKMGEDLAKEIGAVKYIECSARTQEGVQNVVDEAVMAVLENPVQKIKQKRCCLM